MPALTEITVFSNGDSTQAKTWSNVPYFFTKSLEEQGIKVNRVNLEVNSTLNLLYKYSIYILVRLVYPKSRHDYFRSSLHHSLSRNKVKKAAKTYLRSQLFLFLSYSVSSRSLDKRPCVLFGDWTYLYLIENLGNRKPYWFEKGALRRESLNIEQAQLVLSLFPISNVFISQKFKSVNSHYLGNVVNSEIKNDPQSLIQKKLNSTSLLFIGNRKYLEGAKELLGALEHLNIQSRNELTVHFIGLSETDLGKAPSYARFHGYLNKSVDSEARLYEDLLSSATWIVNTQKNWAAFSSMTEAMYHCTAVICRPYPEFIESYGQNCDFGFYTEASSSRELAELLQKALALDREKLKTNMQKAHEKTREQTWTAYCRKFCDLIEKEKLIG